MAQGTNLFTSHEARILATNAGSEEQPIYFTDGEPTATSYALKATVNNGDAKYVAYYSNERLIASSKPTYDMRMPAHYYHNLYEDNPTEGTTVYVHYYNTDTTSTNTFANLRVKSGSAFKTFVFGGDGNCSWEGHILANGGYLQSTANGNTVIIGSENTDFCHFENSANIPFWFNNTIQMAQGKIIGGPSTQYRPFQLYLGRYTTSGSNALNAGSPLIEFSNSDRSQYCQLIYDDWDSLCPPDSLTLVGNQDGINFICKNGPIWIQGGSNAGGNINRLNTSGGMPGNMQYNTNRRGTQIYSNGIAFCDPYNGNSNNDSAWIRQVETTANNGYLEIATGDDSNEPIYIRQYNTSNNIAKSITLMDGSGYSTFIRAYNAVWNDFAEYRVSDITEGGRVLVSDGKGNLVLSTKRLQPSAHVVSDTFGCSVGMSDNAKTPIGVAGRVLVFPYQPRENYKVGDALCAAPNGTADIMTREEIIQYPDRIIGIVDEVPDYKIWDQVHTNKTDDGEISEQNHTNIKVNGRIWIYIR